MNICPSEVKFTDNVEKELIALEDIGLPAGHYAESTTGFVKPLIVLGLAVGFPLLSHLIH